MAVADPDPTQPPEFAASGVEGDTLHLDDAGDKQLLVSEPDASAPLEFPPRSTTPLKGEVGERFPSHAEAKAELFDYIEVFYQPTASALL